jgi:CHAT domain-containing protein
MPPKVSLGRNVNTLQKAYREQALALYQLLVAPIEQQLTGKEDLVLILDGILYYLPFETLITGRNRLLMEDFRISYAPSATIWVNLRKKAKGRNTKELVAFADPLLSIERNLVPLRYTRKEVEGIASLYPQNSREVFMAAEATEEKFKKERNLDCKILHFATHALINEDFPRRSGVVLSSSANGEADGVLQMHEIWNLDLNTELVVLSACQTGLGKLVRGEGMVSLMRAFFYAGTRNVVVSLWNVDDNSTADLMKQFYVHMKQGKGVAESLRLAKLNMIENAKDGSGFAAFEDPYYWSPFILVGPGE